MAILSKCTNWLDFYKLFQRPEDAEGDDEDVAAAAEAIPSDSSAGSRKRKLDDLSAEGGDDNVDEFLPSSAGKRAKAMASSAGSRKRSFAEMSAEEMAYELRGFGTISQPAKKPFSEADAMLEGNRRWDAISSLLDNMRQENRLLVRSYMQREWHKHMMRALLPHIYGHTVFMNNRKRIFRRLAMERLWTEIFFTTSRQVGKTTCVAMFAAAAMCYIPGFKIAIFANNEMRSFEMMRKIKEFVAQTEFARYQDVENAKEFSLHMGKFDDRKFTCYTASNEVKKRLG